MSYNKEDFDKCLFNPMVKKPMIKEYPKLLEIAPDDYDKLHLFDCVLRFICALYDPKSPIIVQERDLNTRKMAAANVAGINQDDEEFLEALFTSSVEWISLMTARFLMRFVKERQWAYIVALEFKFWEGVQRILRPVGKTEKDYDELRAIEIKAKISDEADKDLKRLDTLYKSFFNEDDEFEKSMRNTRFSPETIHKLKV